MKIYPVLNKSVEKKSIDNFSNKLGEKVDANISQDKEYFSNAAQVPFAAIHKIKLKKLDVDVEKPKLIKQIADILEDDISDLDIEDFYMNAIVKLREKYRSFQQRQQALWDKLEALDADVAMEPSRKATLLLQYKGEFEGLKKFRFATPKPPVKKTDDRTDYQLLNKFKSALTKDDLNLRRVHAEHYAGLEKIDTITKLRILYPQIRIPKKPEDVIVGKIVDTFTRDFYIELDSLSRGGDREKVFEFCESKLESYIEKMCAKYGGEADTYYEELIIPFFKKVSSNIKAIRAKGPQIIPENRKVKEPQITKTDVDLLGVDFDDFVLTVLKRQYLDGEKLNDIVYEKFGKRIPIRSLSNTEYKMDKSSEKVKQFMISADKMRAAQRDYDNFTLEQLKVALSRCAAKPLGDNEQAFNTFVSFENCRFEPEDIEQVKKLLRVADDVEDGKLSIDEAVKFIQQEKICPRGTEKFNELEYEKFAKELKAEQQNIRRLESFQDEFDDVINILYKNNMNAVAGTVSKFRPISLDGNDTTQAKFVIKMIRESLEGDSDIVANKAKLESTISRWNTYNYYVKNDAGSPILKKAITFASRADGSIDIDKAGQYIMNAEIVNGYPETASFVQKPEVLKRIMDRVVNKEDAVTYLAKFDDYETLLPVQKTKLSEIMKMFDMKDPVDKQIVKYIVENDYVMTDTSVMARLNDKNSGLTEVKMASSAKQQILEKYKYPVCMGYLEGFEDALSQISSLGSSGIKHMSSSSNRSLEHKMELKLSGHDDRLFSSNNDYVFDIFSEHGMH